MNNEMLAANNQVAAQNCWPSTQRDWVAAQSRVRLGRLDRFSIIRNLRDFLVSLVARDRSFIQFDTASGFEILLPATYRSMLIMALNGVLFHRTLIEVTSRIIRRGDVVIDGGSNVGFFALLAATKLQGSGCVIAFEPDPDTFSLLQENVRRNGFESTVRAERIALTDREGTFEFAVNSDEPMLSSLISAKSGLGGNVLARAVSLDSFLAARGLHRADVIKLDLEGAEPMALEGARSTLPTARMLIFEANQPHLNQLGVDPVGLVEQTAAAGEFDTVFFVDERSEKICPWEPNYFKEVLDNYKFINVACTRSTCMKSVDLHSLQSTAFTRSPREFR